MKTFFIAFLMGFAFTLAACAQGRGAPTEQENGGQTVPEGGKYLTVFYSRSGNSRAIANNLHSIVGGDIAEITPATPYPSDYNQILNVAQQEIAAIDRGNYPAINNPVIGMAAR